MYLGGIIVPILIGCLLTVLTFVVERFLTVIKATGSGNINEFIRKVQYHLANKNVDSAIAECDRQKGSVGNVMKAGLRKYKEMITDRVNWILNKKYWPSRKKWKKPQPWNCRCSKKTWCSFPPSLPLPPCWDCWER